MTKSRSLYVYVYCFPELVTTEERPVGEPLGLTGAHNYRLRFPEQTFVKGNVCRLGNIRESMSRRLQAFAAISHTRPT